METKSERNNTWRIVENGVAAAHDVDAIMATFAPKAEIIFNSQVI